MQQQQQQQKQPLLLSEAASPSSTVDTSTAMSMSDYMIVNRENSHQLLVVAEDMPSSCFVQQNNGSIRTNDIGVVRCGKLGGKLSTENGGYDVTGTLDDSEEWNKVSGTVLSCLYCSLGPYCSLICRTSWM